MASDSRRSPAALLSLGALGALVAMAVIVSIWNLVDSRPPAGQAGAQAPAAHQGPLDGCFTGQAGTNDLTTPPRTQWALIDTMAAPSTTGGGPSRAPQSGLRQCYSRTAEGALLSAANFIVLGSSDLPRKQLAELVANSQGKTALTNAPDPVPGHANQGTITTQIVGYRLVRFSADEAAVEIALQTSNGGRARQLVTLRWEDGDWRVQVADDGRQLLSPMQTLTDMSSFTSWRGA